jgi:hypothetical protein
MKLPKNLSSPKKEKNKQTELPFEGHIYLARIWF